MDPQQGSERAASVHVFAKSDSVQSLFLDMQRAYALVNGSLSKCVDMSSLHPALFHLKHIGCSFGYGFHFVSFLGCFSGQ